MVQWCDGDVELHRIYILERYRKYGVATFVINWVAKKLSGQGFDEFWIEVADSAEVFWERYLRKCEFNSHRDGRRVSIFLSN